MPKRLTAAERDARYALVVSLRRVRTPWAQIGQQLKPSVTAARAYQIYEEALTHNPLTATQVDVHRVEALELCDLAVRRLLTITTSALTSVGHQIDAWNSVRSWEERRAKLTGVDAPTRHEVLTIDMIDAKIAALEAEMGVRDQLAAEGDDDALSREIAALEADLHGGAPSSATPTAPGTTG
jgi:hypothetical protein